MTRHVQKTNSRTLSFLRYMQLLGVFAPAFLGLLRIRTILVGLENSAGGTSDKLASATAFLGPIPSINCNSMNEISPVHISLMESPPGHSYMVSFSFWDHRIRSPNFNKTDQPVKANTSVKIVQRLLMVQEEGAFIDVGANVGFMTHFGAAVGRATFAIDPITYNVAKICEGYRENVKNQLVSTTTPFFLYHAAAGPEYQSQVNITRPAAGWFDQTSLSRDAVSHSNVETETIPLVTVDSLIPSSIPVLLVKIDVQGHELGVLKGMVKLLNRTSNYPRYVFYEEAPRALKKANGRPGACQDFLESYGYACKKQGGDVLCQKE